MIKKKRFYARFLVVVTEVVVIKELRGHPCKNQTKMKFLWQGSKTQIHLFISHILMFFISYDACEHCFYF